MTRRELIYEFKKQENEIISILEELGYESEYDKNSKKTKNTMIGYVNSRFCKGFYGYSIKVLKEKLGLKNSDSLLNALDSKHLSYYIGAFKSIKKKLVDLKYYYEDNKRILIGDASYMTGEKYSSMFYQKQKVKPFADLKKVNPTNTIKTKINLDYNYLKDKTKEELIETILNKSKSLQKILPNRFKENKAYGESIGILTKEIYGKNTGEIKKYLRDNKIKIPNDNILYLMSKEHLIYRYISLSLIGKYSYIYSEDEYDMFIEKCGLIGSLIKQAFEEKNSKKDMFYDFVNDAKNYHNVYVSPNALKGTYSMNSNNELMIGIEYEQMSMFDKPKTRIKEKCEENNE